MLIQSEPSSLSTQNSIKSLDILLEIIKGKFSLKMLLKTFLDTPSMIKTNVSDFERI